MKLAPVISFIQMACRRFESRLTPPTPWKRFLFAALVFLAVLHCFYSYTGIYSYLDSRPRSVHVWAQCQRASIAQAYYSVDMNFFLPRVQRYTDMGGITGVEFPILFYLTAVLYKLFGFNEIYLRIISLALTSLGLLAFFMLGYRLLRNLLLSLFVTIAVACSPVLLFYTPNFLPDAPALGLILVAWLYFFRYLQSQQNRDLIAFGSSATLAGLIKVPSLMMFGVLIGLLVLDRLRFFSRNDRTYLLPRPKSLIITLVAGIAVVFAWYRYAAWLDVKYQNASFCLSIMPGNRETWNRLVDAVTIYWKYDYYAYESYVLMLASITGFVVLYKWVNRTLFVVTFFYLLGAVCFVAMFLAQLNNHDYYIITLLPLVFFLVLTFADAVARLARQHFLPLNYIFLVILFFNIKEAVINCHDVYHHRYSKNAIHWSDYERSYYDLEKRLREEGISRDDVTVSAFDYSYCNTNYLMNQVGWPVPPQADSTQINAMLDNPVVKYFVVNDTALMSSKHTRLDLSRFAFTHRGLFIYRIR